MIISAGCFVVIMRYFYNRFSIDELNITYELLENSTPYVSDCGQLCGNKCCHGGTSDGMLLFPHEKELFINNPGYKVYFDERYNADAVVCLEPCKRNERPLSCRLFPYFIYSAVIDSEKHCTVNFDLRAEHYCPLCNNGYPQNKDFLRNLRMISKVFENNDEIFDFLCSISSQLTDFGLFNENRA